VLQDRIRLFFDFVDFAQFGCPDRVARAALASDTGSERGSEISYNAAIRLMPEISLRRW
jgi:hypothetical protein